eukprot:Seg48.15 transcript_id=Seg48.15/GoldUCD/mRNA.D3Y31 product="hypothetical protein" protein_id=Seg48.15/GoldUCD/D3Y31
MEIRVGFLLFFAFTESLCLHIIVSPDEAQKILKRDDEFSRGLAGFIDKKISESKDAKDDKREKINELKSLIQQALDDADKKKKDAADSEVIQKKEASPPALPLDSSGAKREMSSLETLLEDLLQEVEAKKKRDAQGWTNYGKKEAAQDNAINQKKSVVDSDSELEDLYKDVKRLVKTQALRDGVNSKKSASTFENSIAEEPATEKKDSIIVSDSGERMLENVKRMIAEKKAKKEAKSAIEKQIDNLIKKISEDNSLKPEAVADMTLNGVKKMVSNKLAAKEVKRSEVKSDPKPKVSLDSLMNEVTSLLKKYKKSSKDTQSMKSVIVEDVAVESKRNAPVKKSTKSDRQRELIEELLKSMNKREAKKPINDIENELESLTNAVDKRSKSGSQDKVSKETAEAIKGFDVELSHKKRRSHPK